jgi:hypothetical protein
MRNVDVCINCLFEISIIGRRCPTCSTLYCYGCLMTCKLIQGDKCIYCADIYGKDKDLFAEVISREEQKELFGYKTSNFMEV